MKKIVFFILISCSTKEISAQPYSYYINHTSTWGMYSGASNGLFNYISHFRYMINGDTTIGGMDYFKLFRVGTDSINAQQPGFPSSVNFDSSYAAALREDPSRKFYVIYKTQSTEHLLYDFNLLPGSTLPDMYANYGCNTPPAMTIGYDTVYLGTTPLKRFRFDNFSVSSIIEGVGSGGGLIEQGGMCTGFEANAYILCYKKDNNILHVNSIFPCELKADPVIIDSVLCNGNQLSVFPNPVIDKLHIRAASCDKIKEIKMINSLGQTILFMHGLQQNSIDIDVKRFARGSYYLICNTGKGIITRKIIRG